MDDRSFSIMEHAGNVLSEVVDIYLHVLLIWGILWHINLMSLVWIWERIIIISLICKYVYNSSLEIRLQIKVRDVWYWSHSNPPIRSDLIDWNHKPMIDLGFQNWLLTLVLSVAASYHFIRKSSSPPQSVAPMMRSGRRVRSNPQSLLSSSCKNKRQPSDRLTHCGLVTP